MQRLGVLLCVTLVLKVSSLRKELLAAFTAVSTKTIATSFSSHTCAESVLVLANTLRWLVSSFAHGVVPFGILKMFHSALRKGRWMGGQPNYFGDIVNTSL